MKLQRSAKNKYISQASNFRDLSRIAKLNTSDFLELPNTMSVTAVIWYMQLENPSN